MQNLSFAAAPSGPEVSALLLRPPAARALLVFAHGAGAGMHHAFMTTVAELLAARGVATLRYQFPYRERGSARPDPQPLLLSTVCSAVVLADRLEPDLPRFAGGKSMGGRMSSLAAAQHGLPGVRGLVFFGFPLHPAGRRSTERADHLDRVELPMLFLQGTRDALADNDLIEPVCARLAPRARLQRIEHANHGFHVPKRSGRSDGDVLEELADASAGWCMGLCG